MEYRKRLHLIYTKAQTKGSSVTNVSIYPNKEIMFKKLTLATCLFVITVAAKADEGQKIESKVQKVTVFLNGAQVTRTALVNVPAGTSTIVFSNLSANLDAQSIQLHAAGDFTVLSIKSETVNINDQSKQKELDVLQAQQKDLQRKMAFQGTILNIDQQEEQTLLKNQMTTPKDGVLDIEKLKKALDFQTLRLTEIKKRETADGEQISAYNEELNKVNQKIHDISNANRKVAGDVAVTIASTTALQSTFSLSYLVGSANWHASYDIRAKDVNSPISIAYKANITQQSGEDWKNVKLSLSTGNPWISGVKPSLYPYYLNVVTERLNGKLYKEEPSLSEVVIAGRSGVKDYGGGDVAVAMQQVETQTNVEFSIDNPFTIPGDGKEYVVEIKQLSLPAQYQYYVAPKISTNVFLTASITNWNKYSLLPGQASIFFDGTYTGKSNINSQVNSDTLSLSLGVDRSILITRALQKNLSEKQSLSSNRKETRDWVIDIKNRKIQKINLLVEDQIPVSQNAAIEVETQNISGGNFDKTDGKIAWNFSLNPNDEKKLQLQYMVKYPKTQNLNIQ